MIVASHHVLRYQSMLRLLASNAAAAVVREGVKRVLSVIVPSNRVGFGLADSLTVAHLRWKALCHAISCEFY